MLHVPATSARSSARRMIVRAAEALALATGIAAVTGRSAHGAPAPAAAPAVGSTLTVAPDSAPRAAAAVVVDDTLAGRSGKLRARFVVPASTGLFAYLRRLLGDSVETRPGVYTAPADETRRPFTYITMLPFAQKVNGRIGSYRIGFWPAEWGRTRPGKYGNPAGFIQVTPDNAGTAVSEHFRLGDFLTHDQRRVWPKYLVLDAGLVDKLELVLDDLRAQGYRADRLHVMSGFRTPQYNAGGGDTRGRAELSRHQYGDAADVWVENGNGTMADLTGDGRVDARDAAVVAAAAGRVEQAHPELVGGVGIYRGNGAHGPFVHIDTRGSRARWGTG